ncbi:anti-phage dCTP deaminase [Burkholderia sp. A9]|uniref:anti-phage dCTP deaminase n=1 Tax=Burkholderia sp. A9 TaxID=1365108 RepID=UPI0009E06E86|nr:anti-phage dCTP deaminase [Burkholderia sp. A9]
MENEKKVVAGSGVAGSSNALVAGRSTDYRPKAGEVVFGFVGPTGVDLTKVCNALKSELKKCASYNSHTVPLSNLIPEYVQGAPLAPVNDYERIKTLMQMGTDLRERTEQANIVGRLGLAEIRSIRAGLTGDPMTPATRVAYIVRSFKRPEEVKLFREVYGDAFILISVYSPRAARVQHMKRKFSSAAETRDMAEQCAVELINRDYAETGRKDFGQNVGETFPLADYFLTSGSLQEVGKNIGRLVSLVFGDPYISPTRDEQAMFFAQASALRSLDLSRQVGAAIISEEGDLLSTGCNEVPKFGGGLYWADDDGCQRDVELGFDSNVSIKREMVEDAFAHLRAANCLSDDAMARTDSELADISLFRDGAFIRDSKLFDIIEFGRAVHAEMAAITQAAKNGVKLSGSRLFCTTFPCHICARHILSSGISEVVFIEPYEKSRARDLYGDSISVEAHETPKNKAEFRAFSGVAPRRYMELFQMASKRKTKDGLVFTYDEMANNPRFSQIPLTYLFLEVIMLSDAAPPAGVAGDENGN